MNFFNLDLHISVIADIKQIFNDLGHEININYLSNHSWVFNKSPNNNYVVNQSNWKNITPEICDKFYTTHRKELEKYDGFIVTHIPMLSLLYEKFNKPIIFVASTRYEYPFTNDEIRWKWFNDYINNNNNIITISNNLYDKWYCERFLNKKFDYIPSLCEYTNSKYIENNNPSILYSRLIKIKNDNIIDKDDMGKYNWSDLSNHKSIIHIPYNVSTMSIFEQYNSNIPLLFPDKKLLTELYKNKSCFSEISYTQILKNSKNNTLKIQNIDPNNINNSNLLNKLIEYSDFYNDDMKHVNYYSSFDDLNYKLNQLNFNEISEKMEEHNKEKKDRVYKEWNNILNKL